MIQKITWLAVENACNLFESECPLSPLFAVIPEEKKLYAALFSLTCMKLGLHVALVYLY